MEHPPYSKPHPPAFWPNQENWCKSPVQNGFPPGRARHSIKHKITFFLWTFRVFRKILCQILTPSITASLLSWTIVSALSFPPTLLTIILLFPPFPTLGFLPSHLQEHPVLPQPRRTVTGSVDPSLSNSAIATWATHRQRDTQPSPAASRPPLSSTAGGVSAALPCWDAQRCKRHFFQPGAIPCLGYFCSKCHSL